MFILFFFFFQAEDGIRDGHVTGVQTCALPISREGLRRRTAARIPSPKAASRAPSPRARPGAMGPEAPPCAHQIRSMGEGASRKPAPNTNLPPPTKTLAVCLNTSSNIQYQPSRRYIHHGAAYRAEKGRARRLFRCAKNTDIIDEDRPRRV